MSIFDFRFAGQTSLTCRGLPISAIDGHAHGSRLWLCVLVEGGWRYLAAAVCPLSYFPTIERTMIRPDKRSLAAQAPAIFPSPSTRNHRHQWTRETHVSSVPNGRRASSSSLPLDRGCWISRQGSHVDLKGSTIFSLGLPAKARRRGTRHWKRPNHARMRCVLMDSQREGEGESELRPVRDLARGIGKCRST